jgi:hypothetical protein
VAKIAAHGSKIWLDEIALTSYLNASDIDFEQEVVDVTCFADAGPRRLVGNYMHSGSLGGFFDAAVGAFDPEAFVDFRTDEDHYLLQTLGASAEGSIGYERPVRLKSQPRSSKLGAAVLLNIQDEGSGPAVRATILRSATVTGTGDGTGRNLGATTLGQQLVATYRILAVTGSGSVTLGIKESQDNGGSDAYAAIAALSSGAMTAVGVVRKTATAASEAWKLAYVSAFSGFTNVTILATIGVAPNTP